MKQRFTRVVCEIVKARPETTYDNFARDFGERFVPRYESPSPYRERRREPSSAYAISNNSSSAS